MTGSSDSIKAAFSRIFGPGGRIHVIRAPGRVNLIGEHTDYNDGFVFPMAIEPEVRIVCRGRDDSQVRISSTLFPDQIAEFSVQQKITPGQPKWANYMKGAAAELAEAGIPLVGMDLLFDNTLPMGGGLSSSAAIEVGTALAFLTLAGTSMDPTRLALICQRAEHNYAGVPCGIMDQMIVSSAREGHATLYDCRTGQKQYVTMDPRELRVVIINSMARHELSGGEYAERRRQCEAGVKVLAGLYGNNITALRDVTLDQLQSAEVKLDPVVYRRCRHVITENARARAAAEALGLRRYEQAGELMQQSHASLRDDYEVSCRELDILVREAMKVKGVYGARMTGGGFGGCIVALVQPRSVEALIAHVNQSYQAATGILPESYITTATAAASVIE
jgi:galactokinase